MKHKLLILFAAALPLAAAPPEGFVHWKAADLKALPSKLAPKLDAKKSATAPEGQFGNHFFLAAYREGSGEAEVHDGYVDVFVIEAGEGTLVVGGQVTGGKTTAPGETRGASIQGGEKVKLGTGDIVHIPAGTPHQVLLEPGHKFAYFVVKIAAR